MNGNLTGLAADTPVCALSYLNGYWNPKCWAGTISGGGSGSCDAYAATLVGATLTDGQTLQGQFTNANATTCPMLVLNGGAAKPILGMGANSLGVGQIVAGNQWTLIYDASLGSWLSTAGSLQPEVPTSIQVQLANAVNMALWYNIYPHTNDNGVAEVAAIKSAGLNNDLYLELGDEWWNFPQSVTSWATVRGTQLGFQTSSFGQLQQIFDFYGLRVRQVIEL